MDTFGLRHAEATNKSGRADSSRNHSHGFNSKVATVSDLNCSIAAAKELIHSVLGINLNDGPPADNISQDSLVGFADHVEFQHALTKISSILETNRPDSLGDACRLISTTQQFSAVTSEQLKSDEAADREAHGISKGFGLWRNKQLKMYLRHVVSRSITRKPVFGVEPTEYLRSVTGKALPSNFPDPVGNYNTDAPLISPTSLRLLHSPHTIAEMESLLMKAREASAPSPLRQVSYKMWQMLLPQHIKGQMRSRRKELIRAWQVDTAILDEGLSDDFMFSVSNDAGDEVCSDDDGYHSSDSDVDCVECPNPDEAPSHSNLSECKSVVVYISLITQLVEILAWMPDDFCIFCVRPLFKPKPSAVAGLSNPAFHAICSDPSKFREVMLANSCIRKLIGGMVSRRGLDFIEANWLHKGIQVGYIAGFDPSRLNHCRMNICRFWTSIDAASSEVLVLYDWVSFFSFLNPRNTALAYAYMQLPAWMVNILTALGAPKEVFSTAGGKSFGPERMHCDVQGCPESCFNAIAVSCIFCARVHNMEAGFTLPDMAFPAPKVNAMMQVDDLKVLVGGRGKSAHQVVKEAKLLNDEVLRFQQEFGFMAQADPDPAKSKLKQWLQSG